MKSELRINEKARQLLGFKSVWATRHQPLNFIDPQPCPVSAELNSVTAGSNAKG